MNKLARVVSVLSAALAVGAAGLALTTPAHAEDTATVSVLHAVPGATVDVYANGKALLTDFKPGTLTDPQQLPPGSYDLKVVAAGDGADGKAVTEADDVTVPAGANITVVAHLTAKGTPTLTPFVNDVSTLPAGKARITVRHTAAAPAVDVRAGGSPVFKGLTNAKEATADLAAGTVKADVVLAGTETVAIGPAEVKLAEGTNTVVYAWGSAADKNLAFAVQTISGLHGNPNGVPGGTGGQFAQAETQRSTIAAGLVLVGLMGVVVATRRLARVRVSTRR
ncbi:DUF4397 domain-containing protein [Microlunatus panaciterrae]|uniref:DUF4397 domain-containing protein n=1 Tax=Microlunatus panaciterrae TaxID=400768 RepID=A0ABS2RKT8_9ACTN|nr:DUF4397 domain-containing protein [Microlunatus panaciterrae]MBM7798781.1 hypothetical protein [Microlunatus panaciterrae]